MLEAPDSEPEAAAEVGVEVAVVPGLIRLQRYQDTQLGVPCFRPSSTHILSVLT